MGVMQIVQLVLLILKYAPEFIETLKKVADLIRARQALKHA